MSYIANKDNLAALTNIHYWDSAANAWSGNLLGAATPFAFLPNPVVVGDLALFGIDSTLLNSGPFCSLVFDILTAETGITVIDWLYSDAAGADPTTWAAQVVQDNTDQDGAMTGVAFDTTGIASVHWIQDPLWVTQNPTIGGVALGVTGLWICADMNTVPGAATPPVQQNRDIYTVTWAHADTPEVGGDLSALTEFPIRCVSDNDIGAPDFGFRRMFIGPRKITRGSDYTPFINLGDVQNHSDITVTPLVSSILQASMHSATGMIVATSFAVAAWNIRARIEIDSPLERQYRGDFHLFLRARQEGGNPGDVNVRIYISTAGAVRTTKTIQFAYTSNPEVLDFGGLRLPVWPAEADEDTALFFMIEAERTVGAATAEWLDLILFPVDENAVELYTSGVACSRASPTAHGDLMIDSFRVPKVQMRAKVHLTSTGQIYQKYDRTGKRLVLLSEAMQRHWFLTMEHDSDGSYPERVHTLGAVQMVQRYSSMRGAR